MLAAVRRSLSQTCTWFTYLLTSSVRIIQFYRTPSGRCPVEKLLDSLSDRQAQNKKLVSTDDLWEIRVHIGGNSYRFLGFFDRSSLLILTSGFAKKQQKTPIREIELANQRRIDYLQRRK